MMKLINTAKAVILLMMMMSSPYHTVQAQKCSDVFPLSLLLRELVIIVKK